MSHPILRIVARLLFVLLFAMSGASKFFALNDIAEGAAAAGVPAPTILVPLAGGFEIAASLALLLRYRLQAAAIMLAAYCALTAVLFHQFWAASDPMIQQLQFAHFFKNLSLIGALLWIASDPAPQS